MDNSAKKEIWEVFRKYHYLNTDLHQAAHQWVGLINGELVCHTGIIQFPMRKGWKRVHRLVVLPDYQGIGIGMSFINAVSEIYIKEGFKVNLTTTTPSLTGALRKSKNWVLIRHGKQKNTLSKFLDGNPDRGGVWYTNSAINRITYSFNYKQA